MLVKDYMFKNVCTMKADQTIAEAVDFMVEKKTNSLIITDENNKPVGILSSYSLVRAVVPDYLSNPITSNFSAEGTFDKYAEKLKEVKIDEIMHKDFHALVENDTMIEAASYSIKGSRRILPVVNRETGELTGAITRTCIKNALYNALHKKKQIDPLNGGKADFK